MINKIIGIIICMLFIGVSVSSAVSIDINSTKSNSVNIKDCGCKSKTNNSLICDLLELWVNRINKKMGFFIIGGLIILEILTRLNLTVFHNYFYNFFGNYVNFFLMQDYWIHVIARVVGCDWGIYSKMSNFNMQLNEMNYLLSKIG